MIVFIDTNGTVRTILPSPVYQGQGISGSLYLVAPFPASNGVDVAFVLANGDATTTYALSPSTIALPDVFTENGEQYSVWEWETNNAFVTKYVGTVTGQFRVYAFDQNKQQQTVATAAFNFTVQKGVIPLNTTTPTPSQWANLVTLYSQLKDQVNTNTADIANKVDKTNRNNMLYGTDDKSQQALIPYSNYPVAWTIAMRQANGALRVTEDSTVNDAAVNNKQLTRELAKKLDKVTTDGAYARVYTVSHEGSQIMKSLSDEPEAYTIPIRTGSGTLKGTNAIEDDDLVPLNQFEQSLIDLNQEILNEFGGATVDEIKAASAAAVAAAESVEDTKYKLDNIENELTTFSVEVWE